LTIEILYFDGCPHYRPLLTRIRALLERDGFIAQLELRRVPSERAAQQQRFLGSPTVRIDGCDVEPGAAERSDYGLKCRLYRAAGRLSGEPPDEWIIATARARLRGRRDDPVS
jgi:hypothetical protein